MNGRAVDQALSGPPAAKRAGGCPSAWLSASLPEQLRLARQRGAWAQARPGRNGAERSSIQRTVAVAVAVAVAEGLPHL